MLLSKSDALHRTQIAPTPTETKSRKKKTQTLLCEGKVKLCLRIVSRWLLGAKGIYLILLATAWDFSLVVFWHLDMISFLFMKILQNVAV